MARIGQVCARNEFERSREGEGEGGEEEDKAEPQVGEVAWQDVVIGPGKPVRAQPGTARGSWGGDDLATVPRPVRYFLARLCGSLYQKIIRLSLAQMARLLQSLRRVLGLAKPPAPSFSRSIDTDFSVFQGTAPLGGVPLSRAAN
jgi:hypothetical protein